MSKIEHKVLVYARYGNEPELCVISNGDTKTVKLTKTMIINLIKDLVNML